VPPPDPNLASTDIAAAWVHAIWIARAASPPPVRTAAASEPPRRLCRVSLMSRDTLPKSVIEALQATGATKEMISAARVAFGTCQEGYRAKARERKRAWRARASHVTQGAIKLGLGDEIQARDETRVETPPDGRNLRARLIDASNGNIDALADISPILALIEQGCDLEADILPVIAREVPELPRPLKNWGAPWLVPRPGAIG
jgi:hypothetical protein